MKKNFLRPLPKNSHKYSHGVVGIIAGSKEFAGAALLTTGGARRGGSGYITFLNREKSIRNLVVNTYPDVVVRDKHKDLKVDAWVIGPGTPNLSRRFNIPSARYAVLDAGAMKYARQINAEFVVVTPHEGEARKLGFDIGKGDAARKKSAIEMAAALRCVVVLKGSRTVVASPTGEVLIDQLGGPELATAGTGDILAGLTGSMLASWKPENYSEVVEVVFKAVTAHALAAKAASGDLNPVTSSDILQYLPTILKQ